MYSYMRAAPQTVSARQSLLIIGSGAKNLDGDNPRKFKNKCRVIVESENPKRKCNFIFK